MKKEVGKKEKICFGGGVPDVDNGLSRQVFPA